MKKALKKILNTIDVPSDLNSIISIDHKREVSPESVGMTENGVNDIWQSVINLYKTGTQPAIELCLRRKGEIVLNRSIGHVRGNGPLDTPYTPKTIATPDTPICLFSASKAVTALLVHILAEDGSISLLDPVSYYCPEFAQNGKKNITIHQILSHRGGIPGIPPNTPIEVLWDNDEIWRLLCEAKPISVDGDHLAYHAITGGYVLERVIKTVTGKNIQQYLDEKIRKPMGMKYFTYGVEDKDLSTLAENYMTGPKLGFPISWVVKRALGADAETIGQVINDPRFQEAVIPAGNLAATAEEISRFFQMMNNGGEWSGKRICDPLTIKRSVQEYGSMQIDRTMMVPMRYSAGMMLGGNPVGIWGPMSGSAYGHIGLINKMCWVDEARDISCSMLTTGISFVGHHIPSLVMFVNSVGKNCSRIPNAKKVSAFA
ncbi:serine hydrolase domain-containing protein [Alkalimarinus alittae]|uniref:Beta-lactamase family protein n=1 Tax=Alkalimarinus alittae TaxID=2961619 RepID=A0ABY6N1Y8_9ALTE|nr:serine hydrolase domain-containing protein [Alkalimarinus alittae]UZE96104.1 beta-lactamase family protein [Alkalimarinus alittae]